MLYTPTGQSIQIGRQLGAGGAGAVYEISGQPELVAKRFHSALSAEHVAKLRALVALSDERLNQLTAWPIALLYDKPDGAVVGFLMNRIAQASELHSLHSPKSRLQKFPEATWEFLLYVAANVARAVATVHAHGFIIGDINPKNILVTRQATVHLLDCDSFQVRTAEGHTLRCEQGFPEYTPPELQGVAFRDIDRTAEHDAFGLAVVIFQLLFLGRHPFSGRYLGEGEMPIERAIREKRFAYGENAASYEMQAPLGTLPLSALPPLLSKLFHESLIGEIRTLPAVWVESLDDLAKSLKKCSQHSGHIFWSKLSDCPWCEIEQSARVRLFNVAKRNKGAANGFGEMSFRLDELWRELEAIPVPSVALVETKVTTEQQAKLKPSPEVLKLKQLRESRYRKGFVMMLLAAFLIGTQFESVSWIIGALIVFSLLIVRYVNNADDAVPSSLRNLIEVTEEQRIVAEQRLEGMTALWTSNATEQAFFDELQRLQNYRKDYLALQAEHALEVKRLHTNVRQQLLVNHLQKFKLDEQTEYANLHALGIDTAADLARSIPEDIPEQNRVNLLRWLGEVNSQFTFDPRKDVPEPVRRQIEMQYQAKCLQLENNLAHGPQNLRQMTAYIEQNQKQLIPQVQAARLAHAQALLDCLTLDRKSNPLPMVFLVSLLCLMGSCVNYMVVSVNTDEALFATHRDSSTAITSESQISEAKKYLWSGQELMAKSRYAEALSHFDIALQMHPYLVDAFTEKGYALYRLKRYEEALAAFTNKRGNPSSFKNIYYAGVICHLNENWSDASLYFSKIANTSFSNGENLGEFSWKANFLLSDSYFKLEQHASVIPLLRDALIREPNQLTTRFQLVTLLTLSGKKKEAHQHMQILKKSNPEAAALLQQYLRSGLQY